MMVHALFVCDDFPYMNFLAELLVVQLSHEGPTKAPN